MTDNITVSRELLRQVLNAACSPYCAQDLGQLMPAIRAALEQPAVQPEKLGSEWVPCMKLPVVVHVRNQRDGERHVSTREGITPVKPDDLIMRGVSGEEYPIGRAIFDQTYTFDIAAQPAPVQEQQPAPASKPVLLQCLGCERVGTQEQLSASTDCDCWLHTQPAPVQEPSHDVVAGAIFDFAGFLTSHKVMIEVGSCSNASPMVERIKEWSGNRGLSLENPDVFGWQMRTAQPRKAVRLTTDEIKEAIRHLYQDATALQMSMDLSLDEFRAIEAAFIAKNGWAG